MAEIMQYRFPITSSFACFYASVCMFCSFTLCYLFIYSFILFIYLFLLCVCVGGGGGGNVDRFAKGGYVFGR